MFGPPGNRTALVQLAAISWNFGWPVVAGVVFGWWIDEKLGSSPAMILTFGLGSMITSVWRLVVLAKRDARERAQEEAANENRAGSDSDRSRAG